MNLADEIIKGLIQIVCLILATFATSATVAIIMMWSDIRSLKSARKRAFERIEALEAKVTPHKTDESEPII